MRAWTRRPQIKFCGLTVPQDAERPSRPAPGRSGMIFWPGSPRYCPPDVAAEIGATRSAPRRGRRRVRQPDARQVARTADEVGLTMLQLHGDEGPAFCAEAARRTGCRVIKAARVRSGADIQAPRAVPHRLSPARHLRGRVPGGTGETFAWELARRAAASACPLILSGGLTPDNVGRRDRRRAAVRGRRGQRRRGPPGQQGPGQARARSPPRGGGATAAGQPSARHERDRAPLRPLRRPVRARDADAGAGRARGGVARRRAPTPASRPSSTGCCATTSGGRRRCTSPRG